MKRAFPTPLPVIDFIEDGQPRDGDTVPDPCCGIGDSPLALRSRNAAGKNPSWRLDDAISGVDPDENMVTLATPNMLLNGRRGSQVVRQSPDKGSILSKIERPIRPNRRSHPRVTRQRRLGRVADGTELLKFDVVLIIRPSAGTARIA